MKKHVKFLAAAAAVAVSIAAPGAQAGKSNDTLIWASDREVNVIDNYYHNVRETAIMQRMIWDYLLFRDLESNDYKPLLATSYKWDGNTSLIFELREGVTFHDGSAFDADDVVYTFNHVSNPDNAVDTQSNVNWIKNAEKLGDYKVRLNFKHAFPAALEYISNNLAIVPEGLYDTAPTKPDGKKDWGKAKPIGTGPYMLAESVPGDRVVLKVNKNYFKDSPKGMPTIGTITFRTIPSAETQLAEILSGGIDIVWNVPKDSAEKLAMMPNVQVVNAPLMRISYLQFDATGASGNKAMADVRVRRAISHAVDRAAIAKNLVGGGSIVLKAACLPSQFGCAQDVPQYDYDPAKAKKLLAEAGYGDGLTLDIYGYRQREYTEAVIGYLDKVGIKANLKWLQYKALRSLVWEGKTPINHMTWGSHSILDVSASTSHFFTGGRDDMAKDEEVIAWIKQADGSVDAEERKALYKKALAKIADQAYWLPMFTYTSNYVFSKDLDFTPTPDGFPPLFAASWK